MNLNVLDGIKMRLCGPLVTDKHWSQAEIIQYWDERAVAYEVDYVKTDVRHEMLETICKNISLRGPAKILDVGTGTGRVALKLLEQGADVIASDFAYRMVSAAKELRDKRPLSIQDRLSLCVSDFSHLPFPDDSFDYVTACTSLHHIDTDQKRKAAQAFRRVLHPTGSLILADIMFFFDTSQWTMEEVRTKIQTTFFPLESLEDVKKRFLYEPEEWPEEAAFLATLLQAEGFSVVSVERLRDVVGVIVATMQS